MAWVGHASTHAGPPLTPAHRSHFTATSGLASPAALGPGRPSGCCPRGSLRAAPAAGAELLADEDLAARIAADRAGRAVDHAARVLAVLAAVRDEQRRGGATSSRSTRATILSPRRTRRDDAVVVDVCAAPRAVTAAHARVLIDDEERARDLEAIEIAGRRACRSRRCPRALLVSRSPLDSRPRRRRASSGARDRAEEDVARNAETPRGAGRRRRRRADASDRCRSPTEIAAGEVQPHAERGSVVVASGSGAGRRRRDTTWLAGRRPDRGLRRARACTCARPRRARSRCRASGERRVKARRAQEIERRCAPARRSRRAARTLRRRSASDRAAEDASGISAQPRTSRALAASSGASRTRRASPLRRTIRRRGAPNHACASRFAAPHRASAHRAFDDDEERIGRLARRERRPRPASRVQVVRPLRSPRARARRGRAAPARPRRSGQCRAASFEPVRSRSRARRRDRSMFSRSIAAVDLRAARPQARSRRVRAS